MIKAKRCGNTQWPMVESAVSVAEIQSEDATAPFDPSVFGRSASTSGIRPLIAEGRDAWMRRLVDEHFSFIWRSLRRLGIAERDIDDAAQQVFITVERRRADIAPGKERAFLYGVTLRLAQTRRRSAARSREDSYGHLTEILDSGANPEDMVGQLRARALLDEILDQMTLDVRSVFALCELEEHTVQQAAELLQIPAGTAASRLARARRQFTEAVQRVARQAAKSGGAK